MYPQRSQEELKLCGIKDPTTASDSEVIISRDFFIFLLGHADGDRIAPFLNNRHYRFQFVDDNWFRISPELYNMEVSTIMDQHIRASPHQLHLIKLLLFQRAIRHSILEEATKASTASRPSTEEHGNTISSVSPKDMFACYLFPKAEFPCMDKGRRCAARKCSETVRIQTLEGNRSGSWNTKCCSV